ncbi:hypothetical protein FNH21_15535 [Arthrobacter sp. KR32]|uniref:Uncharacterized protein n=1 Tax=Arthrobacter bussei TaxID=2594179 RepID=A0A7X1NSC5_9MICC|nr:hypothetical protein [Arthrobacter bussei]
MFVARLDIAIDTLRHRQDLIDRTAPMIALLHGQNEVGYSFWTRRRAHVEELLSGYGGSPEGYDNLSDLLQSARTLERKFEDRTRRLNSRMTSMQNRKSDIEKSLLDLQRSKDKLAMSLELTREREALNRTISALDDGPGNFGFVPEDTGVATDLRSARQAVVLAEALLELKGHQGS